MRARAIRVGAAGAFAFAVVGCTWPNPAFDVSQSGAAGAGSEGTSTGAGATTGAPTTGLTSGAGDPTGAVSATGDVSAGSGSTAAEMSSGTGDTTGEPTSCWGLGDVWSLAPLQLEEAGAGAASLSPDGLKIYYRVDGGMVPEIRRAERKTRSEPFPSAGAPFYAEAGVMAIGYPAVRAGETELFFTETYMDQTSDVYVVRSAQGTWGKFFIAGGVSLFGGATESHPQITEDGVHLLFQRNDGAKEGVLDPTWNFYQAARDPRTPTFPDVAPTHVTPTGSFVHPVCPALSPDGLHLFFGAGDEKAASFDELNDGRVGVWSARRDAPDDPSWQDVARSAVLRQVGVATCPRSVTADGCLMVIEQFTLAGPPSYAMLLARRG